MKDTKEKKIGRSFSLKDSELARIESRASKHGFSDRNEYLLALVEVDEALDLEPQLADSKQRILRPGFSSPYSNREKLLASSIGAIGKMLNELTADSIRQPPPSGTDSFAVELTPGEQSAAGHLTPPEETPQLPFASPAKKSPAKKK